MKKIIFKKAVFISMCLLTATSFATTVNIYNKTNNPIVWSNHAGAHFEPASGPEPFPAESASTLSANLNSYSPESLVYIGSAEGAYQSGDCVVEIFDTQTNIANNGDGSLGFTCSLSGNTIILSAPSK